MRHRGILLAVVVLLPIVACAGGTGNPNPGVLPINSHAYGTTYGDLAGAWWSWAMQFPAADCPILDPDGSKGALGQSGSVWFLAGTFGGPAERWLTVPTGKALFLPLANQLWWVPEDGDTEAEVRAIANAGTEAVSVLECEVDGKPLRDLFSYRAQSPPGGFPFEVVAGSIAEEWGYAPGVRDPAVADGYWLLLAPLSRGRHTIHFRAVFGDPAAPDFWLEVTYHITVAPGR